ELSRIPRTRMALRGSVADRPDREHRRGCWPRRLPVRGAFGKEVHSILIVSADPFHREFEAILVTALWSEIEIVVVAIAHIQAALVARISVQHLTTVILAEDADSNPLRQRIRHNLVIVIRLAVSDLFRRKRSLIVEIEIASV